VPEDGNFIALWLEAASQECRKPEMNGEGFQVKGAALLRCCATRESPAMIFPLEKGASVQYPIHL
jgi:hypothetical protein